MADEIHYDRTTNQFVGITEEIKKQLYDAYKGVNIDQELKRMGLWLNTSKGKRRRGNFGFLMNWLNNLHPMTKDADTIPVMDMKSPLGKIYQAYLKELWKDRESLLEINSKMN